MLTSGAWFSYDYWASAEERAHAEFEQGMRGLIPGSYPEAIRHFDRAIDIWPSFADAYAFRGVAHRQRGQAKEALQDLDEALRLNPDFSMGLVERGRLMAEAGNTEQALADFDRAVRLNPSSSSYFQRGQLHDGRGEHERALADFNQAISLQSDAPYAYRARAAVKRRLGDEEGARSDQETANRLER